MAAIGSRVRLNADVMVGPRILAKYTVGEVKAPAGDSAFEVYFPEADLLAVIKTSTLTPLREPTSKPKPSPGGEGGFVEAALDHLTDTLPEHAYTRDNNDRSVAIAAVYARLEQAAAMDRLTATIKEVWG